MGRLRNRLSAPAVLTAALATAGCSHPARNLMPMEIGRRWSYLVRPGLARYVETISVSRRVPVDSELGYELAGDLGICRLAWSGDRLVAAQMANSMFTPALPILCADASTASWRGWVVSMGRRYPARAAITTVKARTSVAGQELPTIESVVRIKIGDRPVELDTWFEEGVGIVRQQQISRGEAVLTMEYLGATLAP